MSAPLLTNNSAISSNPAKEKLQLSTQELQFMYMHTFYLKPLTSLVATIHKIKRNSYLKFQAVRTTLGCVHEEGDPKVVYRLHIVAFTATEGPPHRLVIPFCHRLLELCCQQKKKIICTISLAIIQKSLNCIKNKALPVRCD